MTTPSPGSPSAWERLPDATVDHFRIFQVRRTRFRHTREAREGEFVVIDSNDWVNVVAVTDGGELLLVRQYRFGRNEFTLEVPGGMIEHGEDPVAAGIRELREETGYVGRAARILGRVHPNPAIQSNTCHIVLVEGAERRTETHFDHNEEIELSVRPVEEVFALAESGGITHALVLDALFFLRPWWEQRKARPV
jgi:8-oxo-dGTP pyrophosphatase MutT (NUDIX family)